MRIKMTPENSQNINVSERYIYEYVYPYRIYKGWGENTDMKSV